MSVALDGSTTNRCAVVGEPSGGDPDTVGEASQTFRPDFSTGRQGIRRRVDSGTDIL